MNREIGRRTDGVGIFPDRAALIRLVSAVPNNTTNGLKMRRYIGLDILARSRMTLIETAESEEVTLTAITA